MSTRYELDQLKRRVDHLEHEVGETRRQITSLEERLAAEARPPEGLAPVWEPIPGLALVPTPIEVRSESIPAIAPERGQANAAAPELKESIPSVMPPVPTLPPPLPEWGKIPDRLHARRRERIAAEARRADEPSPVRGWLQQLQLWPPSGEENAEVRLGAWWATRVGALLAVIGVVFFGVYVSLNTAPWVKLLELLAISAGVSVLGLWLERKIETFGAVVFAGGLALGYFTAFAGYAIPAVKVLDTVWAAAGWQIVAVTVMVAAALWRKSPTIATMATGLGFVTAVFSRNGGLTEFALLTAGLLSLVAVGMKRLKNWEGPSVLAMPAAYGLYALVWLETWHHGGVPASGWAWTCLGGLLVLFFARDWRRVRVAAENVPVAERWFQGLSSSIAVFFGVCSALVFYRGELAEFYFGAAALLAGLAWVRSRQVERDGLSALLLAKATGALTLGVIEAADARTTAIALLVQAWVMAWTARRLESKVLAAGSYLVAGLAAWFHFRDGLAATEILSLGALQATVFALGLAALVVEAGRWLVKDEVARRQLNWLGAALAGAAAVAAVVNWTPAGWSPALLTGMTVLFGVSAWARRGAASGWAAALTLLVGNVILWWHASGNRFDANLELNATVVLGSTGALAWVLGARPAWLRWSVAAGAVTVAGAVLTLFNLYTPVPALALTAGGALLLTVFSNRAPGRAWSALATLAAGLGLLSWMTERMPTSPIGWLAGAALALWAMPVVRGFRTEEKASAAAWALDALQVGFATVATLRVLAAQFHGAALVAALAATGAVVLALGLRPGIRAAVPASWVIGIGAVLVAATMRTYSLSEGALLWLAAAVAASWLPAWGWARFGAAPERVKSWWLRSASDVQAGLATLLSAVIARRGYAGASEVVACVAVTLLAVGMFRLGKVRAARMGVIALTVLLGVTTLGFINDGGVAGWERELGAAALAAAVVALVPRWISGEPAPWVAETRKTAYWISGGAGLVLWFLACMAQKGGLAPYVTVGWGLAAAVWFLGGLFLRVAPYRLLGLLGLALCLPRVFFVDLHSTLHRIVAFMVLGVVLLWVGFSYHRFRHLIVESGDQAEK
jgi:Predicted membrane protein (DUF2339)